MRIFVWCEWLVRISKQFSCMLVLKGAREHAWGRVIYCVFTNFPNSCNLTFALKKCCVFSPIKKINNIVIIIHGSCRVRKYATSLLKKKKRLFAMFCYSLSIVICNFK